MKAKRLRTLLVAGILGLSTAMTFSACGGGGGGGGGKEDPKPVPVIDDDGWPETLTGYVLTASDDGDTFTITFDDASTAKVELIQNGNRFPSYASYYYNPGVGDTSHTIDVTEDTGNQPYVYEITFALVNGKLTVDGVVVYLENSGKVRYTALASACTLTKK